MCFLFFIGWSRNFRILALLWSSLGKKAGFQFFLQLLGMDFLLVGRDYRLGEDCRLDLLIHAIFCPDFAWCVCLVSWVPGVSYSIWTNDDRCRVSTCRCWFERAPGDLVRLISF